LTKLARMSPMRVWHIVEVVVHVNHIIPIDGIGMVCLLLLSYLIGYEPIQVRGVKEDE